MFKKFILPAIISLVSSAVYYYFAIPALNIKSGSFWGLILFIAAVYVVFMLIFSGSSLFASLLKNKEPANPQVVFKDKPNFLKSTAFKVIACVVCGVAVVVAGAIFCTSSQFFNASKYQKMLTVNESSFKEDIAEIPFSQIPEVDRSTAERLGSRKIGEVVELVSQFDVSSYYTQINYQNVPTRVSPLQYADVIKWFTNQDEGIPYYVKIDMASPTDGTELVKLDKGMKYSPSEYLQRDLMRHVRFAFPTKMFDSVSFEIDEQGNPYWVVSCYDYTIGFLGGYDITEIVLVDAVTGEMKLYDVSEVPSWVDCVYTADVVLTQANYWGTYVNGWWNSIISQKNVVKTTEGYNYLAIDDDIWVYTGITSVVSDESNIGFILVNLRTKEAKTYSINGAEEYSAMESAQGKIQEKGYVATFPILVNIADTPSYFISLKDGAGLVKAYSFVSVSDYQIVGVGDTKKAAEEEYRRLLSENGKLEGGEEKPSGEQTLISKVTEISSAVVNGNTCYYIMVEGSDKVFIVDISMSNTLPFVKVGDTLEIVYSDINGNITVSSIKETGEVVATK